MATAAQPSPPNCPRGLQGARRMRVGTAGSEARALAALGVGGSPPALLGAHDLGRHKMAALWWRR